METMSHHLLFFQSVSFDCEQLRHWRKDLQTYLVQDEGKINIMEMYEMKLWELHCKNTGPDVGRVLHFKNRHLCKYKINKKRLSWKIQGIFGHIWNMHVRSQKHFFLKGSFLFCFSERENRGSNAHVARSPKMKCKLCVSPATSSSLVFSFIQTPQCSYIIDFVTMEMKECIWKINLKISLAHMISLFFTQKNWTSHERIVDFPMKHLRHGETRFAVWMFFAIDHICKAPKFDCLS